MKKSVICILFGAILMLSVNVAADTYYQFVASQNTLYVDDVKIEIPLYNYQYTNHAPIRAVAEAVGLDVKVTGTRIDFTSPLTDLETVAKNCKDSCVMIYAYKGKTLMQGSGWIYNGYIVTAKHVVDGAEKIDIFFDDSVYSIGASIVPIETGLDIAVLATYITKPSVTLGDSDKLKEGQKLASITSPKGAKNTIEKCLYSGLLEGELTIADTIMTSGSSGGAVFDLKGDLVGVPISHITDTEIMSAIPINDIKPILEQLK